MKKIFILGDFVLSSPTHLATNAALDHSKAYLGIDLETVWIATDEISKDVLTAADGFLVAPGSPYRDMESVLFAITYARANQIPALGTCGGFQHMVIEYARNVLGFGSVNHAEYDPDAPDLLIYKLPASLAGKQKTITFTRGSMAAGLQGSLSAVESYFCSFGVNPGFRAQLENGPMQFSGKDDEGDMRLLELPDHPFFFGTLYVPQAKSTLEHPHPVITGFLRAVAGIG